MSKGWLRVAFYVSAGIFLFAGLAYFGIALGSDGDGAALGAALMALFAFFVGLRNLLDHELAGQPRSRFSRLYFGSFAYCSLLFLGVTIFTALTR